MTGGGRTIMVWELTFIVDEHKASEVRRAPHQLESNARLEPTRKNPRHDALRTGLHRSILENSAAEFHR